MSRLSNLIATAAIGFTALATPAMADDHDHTVYIYDDGFFPEDLYVSWGDKIRYINKTGGSRNMVVPYWWSGSYLYKHEFYISNNASKDVRVWLTWAHTVDIPNSSYGHDGRLIPGVAPRQ